MFERFVTCEDVKNAFTEFQATYWPGGEHYDRLWFAIQAVEHRHAGDHDWLDCLHDTGHEQMREWVQHASADELNLVFNCCMAHTFSEDECAMTFTCFLEQWTVYRPESFDAICLPFLASMTGPLHNRYCYLIDVTVEVGKRLNSQEVLLNLASRLQGDDRQYVENSLVELLKPRPLSSRPHRSE